MTDSPARCGVCHVEGRLFGPIEPPPEDARPLLLLSLSGPTPMFLCAICEASEATTAPTQPEE